MPGLKSLILIFGSFMVGRGYILLFIDIWLKKINIIKLLHLLIFQMPTNLYQSNQ